MKWSYSKVTVEDVLVLIETINTIHATFSKDYFETGEVPKHNLKRTIEHVPVEDILTYRLYLHESINDYLMRNAAVLSGISYYYRVKTAESILDKITRYRNRPDGYAVNGYMNDIFGARVILSESQLQIVLKKMDALKECFHLKNWYLREKEGYRGLHLYFKNQNNYYYPWELQLWSEQDIEHNIRSHQLVKRGFLKK